MVAINLQEQTATLNSKEDMINQLKSTLDTKNIILEQLEEEKMEEIRLLERENASCKAEVTIV